MWTGFLFTGVLLNGYVKLGTLYCLFFCNVKQQFYWIDTRYVMYSFRTLLNIVRLYDYVYLSFYQRAVNNSIRYRSLSRRFIAKETAGFLTALVPFWFWHVFFFEENFLSRRCVYIWAFSTSFYTITVLFDFWHKMSAWHFFWRCDK